jgi:hypothetical protein
MTTAILVFCMTGGFFELFRVPTTIKGITALAIVAILWPGFPRLKEWAYAGIFFNMVGATSSHLAHHEAAWHVIVTVTIAALTLASWALRPPGRMLGTVVRARPLVNSPATPPVGDRQPA